MDLTILEDANIISLFKSKKWPIDEENKYSLYNRFLKTYSFLEPDERQLFIDLSRNFLAVNLDEYLQYLCDLLSKVMTSSEYQYKGEKDIYVMPLIPEKDHTKIKSSTIMTYLFSSRNLAYLDSLAEKNFIILDNYVQLNKKKNNIISKHKPIILTDDFIGSGTQAMEAIKDVTSKGIKKEQIIVVVPYAHETGIKKIKSAGFTVFCKQTIGKGISGIGENKKNLEIMKSIEEKMKIDSRNTFGYMGAEALISLVRTPNNTFPIFWFKGGGKKKNFAPFPRR